MKSKRIALAAAAAALAIAGCGEKTLDADDLEGQLADQLAPQANVDPADVSVACPDDQEIVAESMFDCELTAPNGDPVQVEVTLTDDEGNFEAVVPPQQFK